MFNFIHFNSGQIMSTHVSKWSNYVNLSQYVSIYVNFMSIYLWWSVLEFEKSSSTNWIFSLQKSISIFAGYTGSKNPVQKRLKIQFIKFDFSKLIFQKSRIDQQGDCIITQENVDSVWASNVTNWGISSFILNSSSFTGEGV